jgi:hypothetical protein
LITCICDYDYSILQLVFKKNGYWTSPWSDRSNELDTPRPTVAMFRGWSSHEYWRNDHWPYVATQISIFLKNFSGFSHGFSPNITQVIGHFEGPKTHQNPTGYTAEPLESGVSTSSYHHSTSMNRVKCASSGGNGVYQSIHSCWYHGDILGIWWEYIYIYTQQYDIIENNLGGNGVYQCFPESQTTHFTILPSIGVIKQFSQG